MSVNQFLNQLGIKEGQGGVTKEEVLIQQGQNAPRN